jgi:hypothetical protein
MEKFDVKYDASGQDLKFYGKGVIYMHDTALVLEGDMPKFRIPLLLWAYHKLLNVRTTQTIPYSVILYYNPRSFTSLIHRPLSFWVKGRHHQIIYQLPDGTSQKVMFKMLGSRRENDHSFRTQLEEYMAIARSLMVG